MLSVFEVRSPPSWPTSIFFKAFNDHYGHLQGDTCLIRIAQVLAETVGQYNGLAARYGGEEFVCLISDRSEDEVFAIAEEMRNAVMSLEILHGFSEVAPIVTISLGVATCVPEEHTPQDTLIRLADKALYASKRTGRNRTSH
jgi:diguanylate cyclase (GGDEF)-like protein